MAKSTDENPGEMRVAMAATVNVIHELVTEYKRLPGVYGHQPTADSAGMAELAAEQKLFIGKSGWNAPVQDAHSLGSFSLFAAADNLMAFATLFDCDEAPVFAHLVVARAVIEACVVGAWLNETVPVEERVRRALVERYMSALQQKRIKELRPKSRSLIAQFKEHAQAFGWTVHTGKRDEDLNIDGTRRPSVGQAAGRLMVEDPESDIGKTMWSYLSAVMHGNWHALAEAVTERPEPKPGQLTPALAGVGTSSRSVNIHTICLLRTFVVAAERRAGLMGWSSPGWQHAVRTTNDFRSLLLQGIGASIG